MERILLVEDDEIMRVTLHDRLQSKKWLVEEAINGTEALRLIEKHRYQVVISDIRMPGMDGLKLLEQLQKISPETDVILMTAYGSVTDAVECLKQGAADYMLKPFDMDDLTIRVNRLLQMQAVKIQCASLQENQQQRRIVGNSAAIQAVLRMVSKVAPTNSTVLITGESGTGKELVATAIHQQSKRAAKPYIRINCGAIPEHLIEAELFGHEKGAFTGAHTRKAGKFELADGGTLLLDEIGDLPLALQVKLLRVLQERELERLGGTRPIQVDTRIICVTAKDLAQEVKQGNFREDLYYRLRVFPIEVPPLRERKEDLPRLCEYFLTEFSGGREQPFTLSPDSSQCLRQYDYPGNIRELRNILERATVLAAGPVIGPLVLPADISGVLPTDAAATCTLSESVAQTEGSCIRSALQQTGGNKTEAAKLLGISRKNLWEKMKQHRLALQNDS